MVFNLIKGKKYRHKTMGWIGVYTGSDLLSHNHDFYITKSSDIEYEIAKKGDIFPMNTGCLGWLVQVK